MNLFELGFKEKYPEFFDSLSIQCGTDKKIGEDGLFHIFTLPTQHFHCTSLDELDEKYFLNLLKNRYDRKSPLKLHHENLLKLIKRLETSIIKEN